MVKEDEQCVSQIQKELIDSLLLNMTYYDSIAFIETWDPQKSCEQVAKIKVPLIIGVFRIFRGCVRYYL